MIQRQEQQQEQILPMKRSITPKVITNNKALSPTTRQSSLLRGTASSRAKAVRPPQEPTTTPTTINVPARRFSMMNRKQQSLTNMLDTTPTRYNLPTRRSSMSVLNVTTPADSVRNNDSPSPIKQSGSSSSSSISSSSMSSIINHSSTASIKACPLKEDDIVQDAAYAQQEQQQQIIQEQQGIPLETPPPDKAIEIEQVEDVSQSYQTEREQEVSNEDHHHHHHNHHHYHSDTTNNQTDLPGYMRSICNACNRHVKVSTSSIDNNSTRRPSISTQTNSTKKKLVDSRNNSTTSQKEVNDEKRSNTPTSPIPTTTVTTMTGSIKQELAMQQEKLNELIAEKDKMTLETRSMLEAQMKLLQKFESSLLFQQQQECLNVCTNTVEPLSPLLPATQQPPTTNVSTWQTKIEYGMIHLRWISNLFGAIIGTGTIEEKDFDELGNTNNVVISGVCVTTEPGLLPKCLQKYYILHQTNDLICLKYIIHTRNRQYRIDHLSLFPPSDWVKDEDVEQCQFYVSARHSCRIQFGVFHRRHHCRSCGKVFCYMHSANKLPLFKSNGEERGEWSRVCDKCFFDRIDLISRT